jgi:DNA processing protein
MVDMSEQSWPADLRYRIALLQQYGLGAVGMRRLLAQYGSAEAIFHTDPARLELQPRVKRTLTESLRAPEAMLDRADREVDFMLEHHIRPLLHDAPDFPRRLRDCPDAPVLLYALGPVDVDVPHTVAIVGTRRCTQYGRDAVTDLVSELHDLVPDALIVSGLALGIDGVAHRAALDHGLPTVGVLAHGLDHIYPAAHRSMAAEMVRQGGLLTEYHSHTRVDRGNFLARNRIVAGLADVTLVAESAQMGGSLVTARIATAYSRRVCALPGRVRDERSQGCNQLIHDGIATLVSSAADLVDMMGWGATRRRRPVRQQELDFDATLPPEQRAILQYLRARGDADVTELAEQTGMDSGQLYEVLLLMEMDNRIRATKGNRYEPA